MGSRGKQGSRSDSRDRKGEAQQSRRGAASTDEHPGRRSTEHPVKPPPITSALQWALLGLLIERPSYAYELATRFNRAYAGLLNMTAASQAYPCLDALRRHGLIEAFQVDGAEKERERRRRKLHYRATPEGIAAYEAHLLAQMLDMDRRERLYFRKLAVLARDPQHIHSLLDRFEAAAVHEHEIAARDQAVLAEEREGLSDQSERVMALGMNVPTEIAERLRTEARRLALAAKIEWVRVAREALTAAPSSDRS